MSPAAGRFLKTPNLPEFRHHPMKRSIQHPLRAERIQLVLWILAALLIQILVHIVRS